MIAPIVLPYNKIMVEKVLTYCIAFALCQTMKEKGLTHNAKS